MTLPSVSSSLSRGRSCQDRFRACTRHSSSLSVYHRDRRKRMQPALQSHLAFSTAPSSPSSPSSSLSSSPPSSWPSTSSSSSSSSHVSLSSLGSRRWRVQPFKPRCSRPGSAAVSPAQLLLLHHLIRHPPVVLPAASWSPSLPLSQFPESPQAATAHALALASSLHPGAPVRNEAVSESRSAEGRPLLSAVARNGLASSLSSEALRAFLDGSWQSFLPGDGSSTSRSPGVFASSSNRLWLLALIAPPSCDRRVREVLEAWLAHAVGKKDPELQTVLPSVLPATAQTGTATARETAFNQDGEREQHLPLVLLAASLHNLRRWDLLQRLMTEDCFLSSAASSLPLPLLAFFARLYIRVSGLDAHLAFSSSSGSPPLRGKIQNQMLRKEHEGFFNALATSLALASSPSHFRFPPDSYAVCLQALALFHYAPQASFTLSSRSASSLSRASPQGRLPIAREKDTPHADCLSGILREPEYAPQLHVFDSSELNEIFVRGFYRLLLDEGLGKRAREREETRGREARAEEVQSVGETFSETNPTQNRPKKEALSLGGLMRLTDALLLRDAFMREQFSLLRDRHLATFSSAGSRSGLPGGEPKGHRRGDSSAEVDPVLEEMHCFWRVYVEHQEAVLDALARKLLKVDAEAWLAVSPRTLLHLLHALLRLHRISPDCLGASARRKRGHHFHSLPTPYASPRSSSPSPSSSLSSSPPSEFQSDAFSGRPEEGQVRAEGAAEFSDGSRIPREAREPCENVSLPREQETGDPGLWRNALWASMLRDAIDAVGGPGTSGPIAAYAASAGPLSPPSSLSLSPSSSLSSSSSLSPPSLCRPASLSPSASAGAKGDLSSPSLPPVFLLFARLLSEIRQRSELEAVDAALLLDAVAAISSHPFTRSFFVDVRRANDRGSSRPHLTASVPSDSSVSSASSVSSESSVSSSSSDSSSASGRVARRSVSVERLAESFFSLRELGSEVASHPRHLAQEAQVEEAWKSMGVKALRMSPPVARGPEESPERTTRTDQTGTDETSVNLTSEPPGVQEAISPASMSPSLSPSASSSSISWRFPAVDDGLVRGVVQNAVFRDVHGLTLPAALLLLQALRDLQAFDNFPLLELLLTNVLREAHNLEPQQILFVAATLHGLRHSLVRALSSSLSSPSLSSSSSALSSSFPASSRSPSCIAEKASTEPAAAHSALHRADCRREEKRACFAAVKERRRQRRRLKSVRQMERQVFEMFIDRQPDFLHAPREFAALFYVFSKGGLLTPASCLKLRPSCVALLPRFSPRDLTLFSLGASLSVAPSAALLALPEVLSALFSALAASLAALSPRELATCFWCMHALGCVGSGPQAELRRLVDSTMQHLHRQMRLFPPKELLLIALTVARSELRRQPILLDLFRAVYAFLPLYEPDELAVAVFAFGRARIVDEAIELGFLHHLARSVPFFSPQALAQVVLGLYSLQRSSPSSSSPSSSSSSYSSSPASHVFASFPSPSLSASVAQKREEIRSQLLPRILAEADSLSGRHLASIFICSDALAPTEHDLRQLMRALLRPAPQLREAQKREKETTEGPAEGKKDAGGGCGVRVSEDGQTKLVSCGSGSGGAPREKREARRDGRVKLEDINKLCMLSALELVRVLQITASLSFFPLSFVKCLLFALRKKAAHLDSLQLLSALYALDQLGYAPPRLRWRLGSLAKERIENYKINMSELVAASPVLDRLGVFQRLDVKVQHEIYDRLDEETRRHIAEPLPPPDPSEATSLVAPRARNLALLRPSRMEGGKAGSSKVCLLFPKKTRGKRPVPSGFLELQPGPDPRDARVAEREGSARGVSYNSQKKKRTAAPSPEEEALRREEEERAQEWGSREEKHAAEIFREAIRRL
ncbi:conserved hypothetical protein [Neospora caninum Liverpool]|uniref:Uncharacterized protein n=1 Tax=Neospora caninum (strain Liverpool) TaxID=572307 RepID=F0VP36_NEOCL|nr:conserved hypothetical protein [Neospora caninum Liverpool]CBZ55482.1 conserved hypothetical protein [Neospora caninum Liverpool]CEL70218.1 TPA: hypothetical protein BN1204_059060 [Neospora caninum Liverpool]|eukprot:XP_003885510.1 conserved hypothetical protein [Neospora caninum Liverpool]